MHKPLRIILGVVTLALVVLWGVILAAVPVARPASDWTIGSVLMWALSCGPFAFAAAMLATVLWMRAWLFHVVAVVVIPAFLLSLEQVIENPVMGVPVAGYFLMWGLLYYRAVWQKRTHPAPHHRT